MILKGPFLRMVVLAAGLVALGPDIWSEPLSAQFADPVAQARNHIAAANAAITGGTRKVTDVRRKLQADFEKREKVIATRQELDRTKRAFEASRAEIVQGLEAQADYRQAVERRDEAKQRLAALPARATPADREPVNQALRDASDSIRKQEKAAIEGDAEASKLEDEYLKAQQDLRAVMQQRDQDIEAEQEMIDAKKALADAKQSLVAAKAQLERALREQARQVVPAASRSDRDRDRDWDRERERDRERQRNWERERSVPNRVSGGMGGGGGGFRPSSGNGGGGFSGGGGNGTGARTERRKDDDKPKERPNYNALIKEKK